jgi:7-methyl-GTP pyrophosphatase
VSDRPLVLATESRYRLALMDRLGLDYLARAHLFDEDTPPEGLTPPEVAAAFSAGKARSLAGEFPDALIVGSDQILEHRGRILRKPADLAAAAVQLHSLAGDTHLLHTAAAVYSPAEDRLEEGAARVELTLRPLTLEQCQRYVERDQPHGSVGGYAFEGLGVALFERVSGADESAIVGLPLLVLCRLLRAYGVDPLD